MRRLFATIAAAVVITACGGGPSSSDTIDVNVPQGKCAPSEKNPTLGLAAIDSEYHVHVWDSPSSSTSRDLGIVGDDPFATSTGNDLTVAESVAVSIKDCSVFVGACCEPVSGITFYDKENDGEWETVMGHLPTISPDGELLARVAYEELLISSVNAPEETSTTIGLPKADTATIYRAQWINGDEVALSGFTKTAAMLWVARVSEGTLREVATISSSVNWNSENLWRVGLIGIDESGNVITQNVNQGKGIVEFRYPESFEIFSTDSLKENLLTYSIHQSRSAMVTGAGVLTSWFGNGDPRALDGKFAWAG